MTAPNTPNIIHWTLCNNNNNNKKTFLSAMSTFEDTIDDIENRFLANQEFSLLVGLTTEADNLIE